MKNVFELSTPIGTYSVKYGEFMQGDGRDEKYHCWLNGSGLGGDFNKIEDAKEQLFKRVKVDMAFRLDELAQKTFDIKLFLKRIEGKENER